MSWASSILELFSPRPTYREVGYQHLDTENQVLGLKAFEYSDVLPKGQIRLVKLLNAADGTPIHCELFTTSISREAYNALSYAWGDTKLTHQIVCNGQRLMITANAHSALVHLQKAGEHVLPLWIDSICIRQTIQRRRRSRCDT
jgi:Heterokaryon incompatibility protein (HET)